MPEKELTTGKPRFKPQTRDLTGQRFGRLRVTSFAGYLRTEKRNPSAYWHCICDCGKPFVVRADQILAGQGSCGCLRRENLLTSITKHGHNRVGLKTSEYRTWDAMVQRCHNPKNKRYADYGGRGIIVCEHWRESFESFFADMGPRPSPHHTIERVDNDKGYSPSNCTWVLPEAQKRNMRSNRWLTFNGRTLCLTDWASELGIHRNTLDQRLQNGWTVEKALATPVRYRSKFTERTQ